MLYLIRGLPGSGKSTLAHQMLLDGIVGARYEADMYFMKNGKYEFDRTKLHNAHKWCFDSAMFDLSKSQKVNIAVSNTFTTVKEMDEYVCKALEIGHSVTIIQCNGQYGSVHGVPEEAMKRMRDRFVDNDDLPWHELETTFPAFAKIQYEKK